MSDETEKQGSPAIHRMGTPYEILSGLDPEQVYVAVLLPASALTPECVEQTLSQISDEPFRASRPLALQDAANDQDPSDRPRASSRVCVSDQIAGTLTRADPVRSEERERLRERKWYAGDELRAQGVKDPSLDRWLSQRKIFSVSRGGRDEYPAYVFSVSGGLHPIWGLASVLRMFPPGIDGIWLDVWFRTPHPSLNGMRPCDLLVDFPARVAEAARAEENFC